MSKEHKQIYTALNYIEHLLILASAVTGCVSISTFASLVICAITAAIKKPKSIIRKKKVIK